MIQRKGNIMDFENYLFEEADKFLIERNEKHEWKTKEIIVTDVDYSILRYVSDDNREFYIRVLHGDIFTVMPAEKEAF